jgi:hypothetical protein
MWKAASRGALAGAAGATALNILTYADMALRARPASELPERSVEEIAKRSGRDPLGEGETRERRIDGLGPLAGLATGVGVGVAAGLLRPLLLRLPLVLSGTAVGAAAMTASDVPLTALRLTEPKKWSAADWAADAVPHLAFGLVTMAALRAFSRSRR